MTIYFTDTGCIKFTIKRLLTGALKYLGQPHNDIEMSVSFVSREEIRELNRDSRNVDAVTDVLSFPTVDNPERKTLNFFCFCFGQYQSRNRQTQYWRRDYLLGRR